MLNLDNIFNKFYPKSQTSSTGRKLYIFAWAIEIAIAGVGLIMARQFYKNSFGLENAQKVDGDGTIIALSFIVVALMEITKIPLATAFYYAGKLSWRLLFISALIFVNFSTFETMWQGFDTWYNTRIQEINKTRIEKEQIENKLKITVNQINSAPELDKKIKLVYDKINKERSAAEERRIQSNDQIAKLRSGSEAANPKIKIIEKEIARLVKLNDDDGKIRDEIRLKAKDAVGGTFELKKTAEAREEAKAQAIDSKINEREAQIKRYRDEQSRLESIGANQIAPSIEREEKNTSLIINEIENRIKAIEKNELEPLQIEKNRLASNESSLNREIEQLEKTLAAKKDQLRNEASQNQVYRIALRIKTLTVWWGSWSIFFDTEEQKIQKQINALQQYSDFLLKNNSEIVTKIEQDIKNSSNNIEKIKMLKDNLDRENNNYRSQKEKNISQLEVLNANLSNVRTLTYGGQLDESDLTQTDISTAFLLWFGTLSAVISIIGTLVALASLHLQDERMHEIRNRPIKHNIAKLMKRLNGLVLNMSKYIYRSGQNLLKPKTVEKIIEKEVTVEVEKIIEKPVVQEKIVIQEVEVPKEIERKVFVHVPFPTDDQEILKKGPIIYNDKDIIKDKK